MRIGIVTTWFERGAAYVSKQFEDVISQKHQVFIYARGGEKYAKGDPKWDKPNVYWSQHPINIPFVDKKEIQSWLKKNRIDVVLFNEQHTFGPVAWCKEVGVKTVAYIDYYTEETIPLFQIYDALICNTKRHYSAFDNHPGAKYIPWGTDTDLYKPLNCNGALVEEGKIVFFNSAGMNPTRKGADTFIKALALCKSNNVKAIIHSQRNLEEWFPELATTVEELKHKGILEVVEKTIPAPGLYAKADVYVYPSILDGIGLTVAEAVSSGLACVTSDNPPMNEFVIPETGTLIPITRLFARKDGYYWPQCRCNVEALAHIIDEYATHPESVQEQKLNARKYALEKLCFRNNAKAINDVLEHVELREVNDDLLRNINIYDNLKIGSNIRFIIKHKLYRLPIKKIRLMVGHHSVTEQK